MAGKQLYERENQRIGYKYLTRIVGKVERERDTGSTGESEEVEIETMAQGPGPNWTVLGRGTSWGCHGPRHGAPVREDGCIALCDGVTFRPFFIINERLTK